MAKRIYLSPPHLCGREKELMLDALASNWLAPCGPHVDAFEREFAAAIGSGHALAVTSGTAALHLALRVAGVGRGDTVLVPTFTYVASATPVLYLGAQPLFIDSERTSWNMSPTLLEETLAEAAQRGRVPKAVVVAHIYGQCADLAAITAACDRYHVPLIEDAAEALGATFGHQSAGTFGLMGIFSFNGNKLVTTSGGGMLVSEHEGLIARATFLATQARDPAPHYEHSELGYNYRMSNILAAIGRAQLQVVEQRVAARRRNARIYADQLAHLPGLHIQDEVPGRRHTRWLTCITIDSDEAGIGRDDLLQALARENIEARPLWKPLHTQPLFDACKAVRGEIAQDLFERGLCLPSGSNLSDDDLMRITAAIRRAFQNVRGRARPRPRSAAGAS